MFDDMLSTAPNFHLGCYRNRRIALQCAGASPGRGRPARSMWPWWLWPVLWPTDRTGLGRME